ncbi:DUF4352 domain-containing protein [Prauserella sp. PE36]|uniref:DUF4352 domain-containing protein n=1 Tax=Prauserella sp. PE36 TaxID=1504709 RepID=UPI0018F45BEE|nr:DUF4352 domain-containing protein [Prauserella sp. PE36]
MLTAALGVVAVAGIGSAVGGGDDNAPAGTVQTEPGQTPETAGLNTPVRDGKFEFTVSKLDCGETEIGGQYPGKTAQGQFCFVWISVENIGSEPQTLFGANQKLFDAQGREFSPDTEAALYLDSPRTLWEEINPGNRVDGVVVFDIPDGTEPSRLELHDSAFSGGASVRL